MIVNASVSLVRYPSVYILRTKVKKKEILKSFVTMFKSTSFSIALIKIRVRRKSYKEFKTIQPDNFGSLIK